MAKKFTQANRPLAVRARGLDPDALLLVGFAGDEAISTLFHYRLDVLVENPGFDVFDKVLGQSVTVEVELPGGGRPRERKRLFNGICRRVTQGERDKTFTRFQLDLVPALWRLTKIARSRVFQHKSVPDILMEVLKEVETRFRMTFELGRPDGKIHEPRDYCVQYRETDFAFASRLMAEEGIQYYFDHDTGQDGQGFHQMVLHVGNFHPVLASVLQYRSAPEPAGAWAGYSVFGWEKAQELRAGRVRFRDHTFEMPEATLEVQQPTQPDVRAGGVTHKLTTANAGLELYDYPGQYAKRFDGIDRGGGAQPDEPGKVYPAAERTARVRMELEATAAVAAHGQSDCRQFTAGEEFTVETQKGFLGEQARIDGSYLLTAVQHAFGLPGNYASGSNDGFYYRNTFSCVPADLPYRPARAMPRPVIAGTQTAVVVGPPGEELYVDKYGRVKVQFFWDREGKKNLDSSCWVRVAQVWAGQRWGAHFWPRVGQEVVVAFEEGDPDQPIVVGSVYNAGNLPPYELAKHKTRSGVKTHTTPQGTTENCNEIRFEDQKGAEELYVQAERTMNVLVKGDENRRVGGHSETWVSGHVVSVSEKAGNYLWAKKGAYVVGTGSVLVASSGEVNLVVGGDGESVDLTPEVGKNAYVAIAKNAVSLQCGGGFITIDSGGNVYITGTSVNINSGGAPVSRPPSVNGSNGQAIIQKVSQAAQVANAAAQQGS